MASIFASRTRRTLDVPFDDGQTVTIQKLSGRQLERARQEQQFASLEFVKRIGGASFQRELQAARKDAPDADQVERVDPYRRYDRATVLQKGIVDWSYGAITPEAIDDLSEQAADWLAHEILTLTLPDLDGDEKKSS
jgi:DNA replication initiation complex subunit (GINS family)